MITALVNGILGVGLVFAVGIGYLDLSLRDGVQAILDSNVAGFFSLFLTLRAERISWMRRWFLSRTLQTCTLLVSCYFGLLLWMAPALRDFRVLMILILPLVLSTGFSILAFSPVQDFLVRQEQQKNKTAKS